MRNRLLEAFFTRATIRTVTTVGRFRYLRLHAPQFVGIDWIPGQQQAVRSLLIHGPSWIRRTIHTKPFWAPGKRGME